MENFIKPFRRGFFCDDESIMLPKLENTVSLSLISTVGLMIPLIMILLGEFAELRRKNVNILCELGLCKITNYTWNVYRGLLCFVSGALYSTLIVEVGKLTVGRLRPNFIQVCGLDLEAYCRNRTSTPKYIANYSCIGDDDAVKSRVSFPSGHASFSFYVAIFIVLYLEKIMKYQCLAVKSLVQFFFLLLAWFVSLTRIMDNEHHWSDVVAGIIIGSGVSIINTVTVHSIFVDDVSQAPHRNGNRVENINTGV